MSEFKWSKPDERKPENGEKYLLCDLHGDISVGFWSDEKTVKLYEGRQEYVKRLVSISQKVIWPQLYAIFTFLQTFLKFLRR